MRISWLILLIPSGLVNAAAWTCPKESIEVYGYEFCEAEHLQYKADQANIRLDKTYKSILNKTSGNDRQHLMESHQAWLKSSQVECDAVLKEHPSGRATLAEMAASCREEQILKRTKELESHK